MKENLVNKITYGNYNIAHLYNVQCLNKSGTESFPSFYRLKYLYLPSGIFRSSFQLLQLRKDFDNLDEAEAYLNKSFISYLKYIIKIFSVKTSSVFLDDFSSVEPIKIDLRLPRFENHPDWFEVRYNEVKIGSIRNNANGFMEKDGRINRKRFVESYDFVNYDWAIENRLIEIRESNSIIESYENLVKNFELFAEKIVDLSKTLIIKEN